MRVDDTENQELLSSTGKKERPEITVRRAAMDLLARREHSLKELILNYLNDSQKKRRFGLLSKNSGMRIFSPTSATWKSTFAFGVIKALGH